MPDSQPTVNVRHRHNSSSAKQAPHHQRVGSFVGSLGRQGFQLPLSKREREHAKSLVFSDRLDGPSAPAIEADASDAADHDDFDPDIDGPILEEGIFAPSESQRIQRERQELLHHSRSAELRNASGCNASGPNAGGPNYGSTTGNDAEPDWDNMVERGKVETTFGIEVHTILTNSLPLAVTFFLQYSLIMSSLFSVGHLGKLQLAAVSLGAMTASITGMAFIQGMSTCLDTLCSQAYGAGRPDLVGLYFQKGVLVVLVGLLPIVVLWYHADLFLPYIVADEAGDTDELIMYATKYLRMTIFALPGYTLFECGKRFLQAQNIFHASTIVLVVCAPLNILLTYVLVWNKHVGLGFIGAPLAVAITDTLLAVLMFLYVVFVDGKQCWNGFTWKVFTGWGPLVRLAIPGLIMVESEFLAYEIMTLASSYLGTSELATQTIMSSVTSLAYEIPFAVGCAASTRVANFIGAGLPAAARLAATAAILVATIIGAFDAILIYLLRYQFSNAFSSDPSVINHAAMFMPLCAAMHLMDSVGAILASILRGQGRQKIGGYINLASYYLLGVPLGLFLCFGPVQLGLAGIWLGFITALMSVIVTSLLALRASRWSHYVELARNRD